MAPEAIMAEAVVVCLAKFSLWLLWLSAAAASRTILACLVWTLAFVSDIILLKELRRQQKPAEPLSQPDIRFVLSGYVPGRAFFVFDNIAEYLTIHSVRSAELTAELIDAELPARRQQSSLPPNASADFLWTFWEGIFSLAHQIPHDHLLQDKLVRLIVALANRPPVLVRTDFSQPTLQLLRIWEGMTEFYNCSLDFMRRNPDLWQPHEDKEKLENWVNFQAFLARVQATGLTHSTDWAALALQGALDGEPPAVGRGRARWEAQLRVAALWVEHAGENMWWHARRATAAGGGGSEGRENENKDEDPLPRPGRGLDERAWRAWARRLRDVARDGTNAASVRLLADDAHRTMDRLAGARPSGAYDDAVGEREWLMTIGERGGPDGMFDEPVHDERAGGPHGWGGGGSDDEEDGYFVDPLRPPGGYLPYAILPPDADNQIARAA